MNRQNVDLGSGKVSKLLFSLALPTITSQIVNMLYNLNLFWDIEKQYHHKNNKLKANNKSIYYFGPMTKK